MQPYRGSGFGLRLLGSGFTVLGVLGSDGLEVPEVDRGTHASEERSLDQAPRRRQSGQG